MRSSTSALSSHRQERVNLVLRAVLADSSTREFLLSLTEWCDFKRELLSLAVRKDLTLSDEDIEGRAQELRCHWIERWML